MEARTEFRRTQVVDDRAFTADGWSKESGDQFIEGTGMWCRPNAEATVKFTGTKVWLVVRSIEPRSGRRISTATRYVYYAEVR